MKFKTITMAWLSVGAAVLIMLLALLWPLHGFPLAFDEIFWNLRLPRILFIFLSGGLLASSGVLTQAYFNNALAVPSVLGTETAAMLAGSIAIAVWQWDAGPAMIAIPWAGIALAWVALVALQLWRGSQSATGLLLAGFALNALFAAGNSLLTAHLQGGGAAAMRLWNWLGGRFMVPGWAELRVIAVPALIGWVLGQRQCPQLNVMSLGEQTAESLGVSVFRLFVRVALSIALMSGSVSSLGYVFPFVGLIVPFLVRRMMCDERHQAVYVMAFFWGGILTVVSEWVVKAGGYIEETPPGVVTTILGVVFFFWLMGRREYAQ